MTIVCAVSGVERPDQTRPPDAYRDPREGLASLLETWADWFWLVDESVEPEPGALEALLAALENLGPLPEPVLLASKVVRPGGDADPAFFPVPRVRDPDLTVDAFERHVVPIRLARGGSLLVHRRGLAAAGMRRRHLEWTARLLRREPGLLVPASVAVSRGETRRDLTALARLLVSDALEPRERPLFA